MFLRSDAVPPNLQVDQRLQPLIYLSSSTLEAVKRPLREYGYNTGIQSGTGHCHVNRVEPQRPAWIPFQAAALAVSHTLNASFRNRLNVSLLHK